MISILVNMAYRPCIFELLSPFSTLSHAIVLLMSWTGSFSGLWKCKLSPASGPCPIFSLLLRLLVSFLILTHLNPSDLHPPIPCTPTLCLAKSYLSFKLQLKNAIWTPAHRSHRFHFLVQNITIFTTHKHSPMYISVFDFVLLLNVCVSHKMAGLNINYFTLDFYSLIKFESI